MNGFAAHDVFGIAAFAIIVLSESIYIHSIFVLDKKTGARTRPSRSTFWIWTAVQGILAASYIASGEVFAAGLSVAYALMFAVIALLSIRYGYSTWERSDTYCASAVLITIVLWGVSGSSLLALAASVVADFIGAIPTIKTAIIDPTSESRSAWALTVFACVLNILAVRTWGVADAVYIPYLIFVNGLITAILFLPRRKRTA